MSKLVPDATKVRDCSSVRFGWLLLFYATLHVNFLMLNKQLIKVQIFQTLCVKHMFSSGVLNKLMVIYCAKYYPTNVGQLPWPLALVATIRKNEVS